mmetsp:Transcript_99240/g.256554  ORF Transcript_99240/g.256554 Transcript_99240/m.256554 type:complete len:314 (+) Transcript_99240:531-1472(+)
MLVLREDEQVRRGIRHLGALRDVVRGVVRRLLRDIADEGRGRNLLRGRLAPVEGVLVDLVFVLGPEHRDGAANLALLAVLVVELEARRLALRHDRVLQHRVAWHGVLAKLVFREDEQVRGPRREPAAGGYPHGCVGARRSGLAHQGRGAVRELELRPLILAVEDLVGINVELVASLRDLHLAGDLVLVHVLILEAQARLLGGHAGADAGLHLRDVLARALRAVAGLFACVGGEAVQLLARRAGHGGVRHRGQPRKLRVQLVLHLHPHVHVTYLRLLVGYQPRPLPRPSFSQRHAELPHGGRAPARRGVHDGVE